MNSMFLKLVGLVFFLSVTSCEMNTSKSKNDQSEAFDGIAEPIATLPEVRTFFIPKNTKKTFAELIDKNNLSHRYKALKKFSNWYLNK